MEKYEKINTFRLLDWKKKKNPIKSYAKIC